MQIDYAEGTWQIIQCQGCGEVSFREMWITSEDINPNGEAEPVVTLYPNRDKDNLLAKDFVVLPSKLRKIYKEVIESYNSNLFILCATGLRSIVEGICHSAGIEGKNLQLKIEGLHTKGYLTQKHATILHEHRYMGNSAVHELDIPTKEELFIAIRIIEHTIENLYEIEDQVDELRWLKERRLKKSRIEKQ
ncbi:DUF4145 domain-containing protein [Paenibacillus campinasensis]|uniref:DUF4145 domain-containing protein n=1 Tax=Paenibacillus campinasensis TaxID=66347 RepID=A0A268EDG1_9BACL|nr:DUF4145 domain-containing protein [Paenibacillus campinasensis]PAD71163.1 hypothetical protein CHH67_25590 [Paenibacillus campinasensis]